MKHHRTNAVRALALVAVTSLALTACGRDASDGGSEGQGEAVSEGEASGEIEVWAMGTEGEMLGDFSQAFMDENPDADVKVTAVPWDAAHDKIANAIASGETPDVTLLGSTWMGEFGQSGGIEPIPEGLVESGDFFEGAWNSNDVGGTIYGVPWYVETRVLYYRKDLAKKAGWNEPPQSWDDLKQFTQDLMDKGGAEYGISLPPGGTGSWQTMMPFAWSNGASLTNEEGTEYTIDSPEMAEALEYYKSFFDDGITVAKTMDAGELESGFADGTYASFISGPWHAGLVEEAGVSADQYGVAMLPGPDSPGTSFVGGGNLGVFTDSDNKENAWKYVQWLADPETQQGFYDEVGDLPSVQAAWESGALADDAQLQIFGEQLANTQAPPAVPTWEEVAGVVDSETEKVTRGDMSVEDAIASMQEQASGIGTGL